MSDVSTDKVVANREMSLDGFNAGPSRAEVAKSMAEQDTTYDSGTLFVLTNESDPAVTNLSARPSQAPSRCTASACKKVGARPAA